jgi:hypothetical protein
MCRHGNDRIESRFVFGNMVKVAGLARCRFCAECGEDNGPTLFATKIAASWRAQEAAEVAYELAHKM